MKPYFILLMLVSFLSGALSAADDTREVSLVPKEIYGSPSHNIRIRLGNGGAGPTGLLKALADDYIEEKSATYSIAWYQDVSPKTLEQLKNGVIDIALVYEKNQGDKAVADGWATHPTPIFNDHFLIVGPISNPASIATGDATEPCLRKIAQQGSLESYPIFLSRDDQSATNVKEQSLWTLSGLSPWTSTANWYFRFHVFPKDALIRAAGDGLYTITDRGTWLSTRAEISNCRIYVEGGEQLLNPCFALLGTHPNAETLEFLTYLTSIRAQHLISEFGKDIYQGDALFTSAQLVPPY